VFAALLNLLADLFGAFFGRRPPSPVPRQTQPRSFSAEVLRADDLLVFRLDFYNARLNTTTAGREIVSDGPGDSFVVVQFPSQHIAEQAFLEGDPTDQLRPPPVAARLAGESRLVFHLNPALLPLEFSLESILGALPQCATLMRDRIGQPPPTPPIGGSSEFGGNRSQFTAIEAPWRMILSPHEDGRWTHSAGSVTHGTKTELWHTRLGVKPQSGTAVDERSTKTRTARAVYSPDYRESLPSPPDTDLTPFRSALSRYHRHNLVMLTADPNVDGNAPVAIERLMLSALGAGIKLHGAWDTTVTDIVDWIHQSTLGRDQYVQVVKKGFLFPLGNRAVEITLTERKLEMSLGSPPLEGHPIAYARQRIFILLREPIKKYFHRAAPFRSVEFKTLKTPNLLTPAPPHRIAISSAGASVYWPRYNDGVSPKDEKDVMFLIEGTDWDAKVSSISVPLIFVPFTFDDGPNIDELVVAYNGAGGMFTLTDLDKRTTIKTGGQKIAFAPSIKPGDTSHETDELVLGALNATGLPHFLPAMSAARINNPALRQISKNSGSVLVRYDGNYLSGSPSNFGNPGEVYVRVDNPPAVNFPAEKTGGLVAPDFTPQGFSRTFGPVGDVGNVASGTFNPAAIFAGIKILGAIELDKIFKLIPFSFPSQAGPTVPGLTTREIGGPPAEALQTRYLWTVNRDQLQNQPLFLPQAGARFELDAIVNTPLDGKPSSFSVNGKLEKFELVLPPGNNPDGTPKALVGASFDHVSFSAGTGKKVDVSVKFNELTFHGVLEFVNDIRKYIPLDGFVDPPFIDVNADGITAGFTLALPTIGVGIFTLADVSLGSSFHLPLIGGEATLRFAFCERDHPFLLTVSLFGGGGFFALVLDTAKVVSIEASIEFGAAIAINLGVAAGKASITAGVYYQGAGAGFIVTAFFRAVGELSVLGIISVSVELYVGLTYASKGMGEHGGHLYGTASVKVKIKICFFSISVSISIEREFAGSDPTFVDMIGPGEWGEYCGAFAPEP
jgi:hypothetical protein